MSKHTVGTKTHCETLAKSANKLLRYPRAGRNALTKALVNPDHPGSCGWTMRHAEPRKHPTKMSYAYPIDAELEAALSDPKQRELCTAAELNKLDDAKVTAVELPKDWTEINAPKERKL